ncbi:MAG: hypothetical protein QW687_00545 [Candidatus Hadarchaeales archaeon]
MVPGVWFREEIERVILVAEEAVEGTIKALMAELGEGKDDPYVRGYRDGSQAVLRALSSAFGVRKWE